MIKFKILRFAAAATLFCLVIISLISCTGTSNGIDTGTDSLLTSAVLNNIDLSEYTVIRPSETDEDTLTAAGSVYTAISSVCATTITDDWLRRGELPDDNAKEILIGNTNRPQSREAAEKIEGYGWIITQIGNKICIMASDNRLLTAAAEAFAAEYINKSDNGKLNLTEGIFLAQKIDIKLSDYTIVLRAGRDSYEEEKAGLIEQYIEGVYGTARLISESDRKYSAAAHEILIGNIDCPEVNALKKELGAAEYGVFYRGNKIILFGWSLATTIESTDAFLGLLKKNTSLSSDGKFVLTTPAASDIRLTHTGWNTSFPQFNGGVNGLEGTYDCGLNDLAYFYSSTTESEVNNYTSLLKTDGYTLYSSNKIGNYSFSVYKKADSVLYLMRNSTSGFFRIISSADSYLVSSDNKEFTKVADASLTQMCLDYSNSDVGMSYIFTLEDGRFVIIDGGHPLAGEALDMLRQLEKLNTLGGKPQIAAWIITHTHSDHSGLFQKFSELYAGSVILERLVMNLPGKYTYYNTNHGSFFYPETEAALKKYSGSPLLIIPQTGDVMKLSGARIEFLYTHVDFHPQNLDVFNDSSLVFRITISGQTILFLGDVQPDAASVIVGMYGSVMKSDMVQMAHHGYSNGGSKELYDLIDPAVIFWPSSPSLYESRRATGVGGYVIGSLHVKKVFTATTETITIKLPYTP